MKFKKLRLHRYRGQHERGFTLVEVLVVAMLLIVLAGIAVVGFRGATAYSQRRACEADLTSVVSAIKAYGNDWAPQSGSTVAPTPTIDVYSTAAATPSTTPTNIVPMYLAPLAPAASGTNAGQPYRIAASASFPGQSAIDYSITVQRAPSATVTVTVTPGADINLACRTALS